jgi:hypothetical protein
MTTERAEKSGSGGIGVEDLPGILRELFDSCIRDARAEADPSQDFESFADVLWRQVDSAFSLTRQDWPEGTAQPWSGQVEEHRGLAEAVLEGRLSAQDLPT